MLAKIIPEKRTNIEKESFTYLIPEKYEELVRVGSIVRIPFGKRNVRGVVAELGVLRDSQEEYEIKEVTDVVLDISLPPQYVNAIRWIASYYLCSSGEAAALFLPPDMKRPRKPAVSFSQQAAYVQHNKLTASQEKIFLEMAAKLKSGASKPSLLFGVTSSGKTEVYLRLVREAIEYGKQAIVLVPEIMLTTQIVERFEEVFAGQVALVHSELSKSEKYQSYMDFYSGKKSILIGPRSALVVPCERLGLIIVDEEGEGSYKQENNPKYHAVRLAEELAKLTGSLLVLGSATPTIESYHRAQAKHYDLHELSARYLETALPSTKVVDLRDEIRIKNFSPLSLALQEEIASKLKEKRQVFLFLNRRGTATFVSCRECGEVIICPHCSVPMVYHINDNNHYLNCHHCDHQSTVPLSCPTCHGYKIKYFGAGVERIEQEIRRLFPFARVKRIDSSSLNSKKDYQDLYYSIKKGDLDIIIGTQIIAKGLDIPAVDLVGVVSADVGLHLPHYKADERTFQLLTQVSGRSGRRGREGRTIIQTYWPESRSIISAQNHDYSSFYHDEINERQKYNNPPFSHLVRVIAENSKAEKAKEEIGQIAKAAELEGVDYIGPAKAFLSKIRSNYRYHIILKASSLPDERISRIFKVNPYLFWDVDPENLL